MLDTTHRISEPLSIIYYLHIQFKTEQVSNRGLGLYSTERILHELFINTFILSLLS